MASKTNRSTSKDNTRNTHTEDKWDPHNQRVSSKMSRHGKSSCRTDTTEMLADCTNGLDTLVHQPNREITHLTIPCMLMYVMTMMMHVC